MGKHTQTPQEARKDEESGDVEWYGANGDIVKADDCDMVPEDKAFVLRAVNAHDALVAALEVCIEEINDSAQEIAENGGVTFDRNITWPEGSAIAQAQAALALARS